MNNSSYHVTIQKISEAQEPRENYGVKILFSPMRMKKVIVTRFTSGTHHCMALGVVGELLVSFLGLFKNGVILGILTRDVHYSCSRLSILQSFYQNNVAFHREYANQ